MSDTAPMRSALLAFVIPEYDAWKKGLRLLRLDKENRQHGAHYAQIEQAGID